MLIEPRNNVWLIEYEDLPTAVRKLRLVKRKIVALFYKLIGIVQRVLLDTQKIVVAKWDTE